MAAEFHQKCRGIYYPRTKDAVRRYPVPDQFVSWANQWEKYSPTEFTSPVITAGPSYADPEINAGGDGSLAFNKLDDAVDRRSHMGKYELEPNTGRPRNPMGRTGIRGRGVLGKWGPNHAADPIVSRWKLDDDSKPVKDASSNLPILQAVLITRGDCGELAIPGGMVDPGEQVTETLLREFCEEALDRQNGLDAEADDDLREAVKNLFSQENGKEIYKGYVDDPRNTDNAWMETVAVNFHDENGITYGIPLRAGSDAAGVKWVDLGSQLKLYASHAQFVAKVCKMRKAHW